MKNFILENLGYVIMVGIIAACTVALSIQIAVANPEVVRGNSVSLTTSVTVVP